MLIPRKGAYCVLFCLLAGCATFKPPATYDRVASHSGALVFRGISPIVPDPHMRGIWTTTQQCLQQTDTSPDDVRWAVAEYIVDVQGKQLLWGVVAMVDWEDGPALTIVLDAMARHSDRVISHEAVHVIANVYDGDWRLDACLLYGGPADLGHRPLNDPELATLTAQGSSE